MLLSAMDLSANRNDTMIVGRAGALRTGQRDKSANEGSKMDWTWSDCLSVVEV
jgi:hypothetical protein